MFTRTVVSGGRLTRNRDGGVDDVVEGTLSIEDERFFDFLELRQDWTLETSPPNLLKWGFDATSQEARYNYLRNETPPSGDPDEVPPIRVNLVPDGTSVGIYLSDRFQPVDKVVVEVGLRWDSQSWIDNDQLSPRINLMVEAGRRTTVRAAWGRFYQSQRLNELQVEDGVTEFFPAQLAEHWMAGLDYRFNGGLGVRVEAYQKNLSELRPRYENLFSPLELFPEAQDDRILVEPDQARARGVEVLVKSAGGKRVSWWLSYGLASVEDDIDGDWQARNWDQPHAASFGLNLALPRRWNLNFAGFIRSGFPTTEVTAVLVEDDDGELVPEPVIGPRNGARYPAYHRFDLRATKVIPTRHGEFSLIFEVVNLMNTRNVCCIDDFEFLVGDDGTIQVIPQQQYWAPIIPSVGFSYQF